MHRRGEFFSDHSTYTSRSTYSAAKISLALAFNSAEKLWEHVILLTLQVNSQQLRNLDWALNPFSLPVLLFCYYYTCYTSSVWPANKCWGMLSWYIQQQIIIWSCYNGILWSPMKMFLYSMMVTSQGTHIQYVLFLLLEENSLNWQRARWKCHIHLDSGHPNSNQEAANIPHWRTQKRVILQLHTQTWLCSIFYYHFKCRMIRFVP